MTVIHGRQLKAGRIILGLTVKDMAQWAGLHKNSVMRVEKYGTLPHFSYAAAKIEQALKILGIEFEIKDGRAGLFFHAGTERRKASYKRKSHSIKSI